MGHRAGGNSARRDPGLQPQADFVQRPVANQPIARGMAGAAMPQPIDQIGAPASHRARHRSCAARANRTAGHEVQATPERQRRLGAAGPTQGVRLGTAQLSEACAGKRRAQPPPWQLMQAGIFFLRVPLHRQGPATRKLSGRGGCNGGGWWVRQVHASKVLRHRHQIGISQRHEQARHQFKFAATMRSLLYPKAI